MEKLIEGYDWSYIDDLNLIRMFWSLRINLKFNYNLRIFNAILQVLIIINHCIFLA